MDRDETRRQGWVRATVLLGCALLLMAGCQKSVVGDAGNPVQEPEAPIAVTVESAKLERLQVEGPNGPLIYKEPVLVVRLKLDNTSGADFTYVPTHSAERAPGSAAPLLFVDPGPEGEIKTNIPGIVLEEKQAIKGQLSKNTSIAGGSSANDAYLFSPPDKETLPLILTIPPSLHGGKGVLKIKVPYEKNALPKEKAGKKGESVKVGDAQVLVSSTETTYLKLKDVNQGEGFSRDPVFVVKYTVSNTGKKAISYKPNHGASGDNVPGIALRETDGSGVYMRVRFGADREVTGQIKSDTSIEPGKKVEDMAIFERPPKGVKSVTLMVPGSVVGQSGLARIALDYKHETPSEPEELNPKKKEEEKKDK